MKNLLDIQILDTEVPGWGYCRHMKVTKNGDKEITWDELQAAKNEYLGKEASAIEVYPPALELVDEVRMRHLWEVPLSIVVPSLYKKR